MSRNTYQFELRAKCPIHEHLIDTYALTIRSDVTIPVENILAFVKKYESQQIFQEALTEEIAVGLGVHVETIGTHSGVKVRCEAP